MLFLGKNYNPVNKELYAALIYVKILAMRKFFYPPSQKIMGKPVNECKKMLLRRDVRPHSQVQKCRADNPDEYAEIVEKNFGIFYESGYIKIPWACLWGFHFLLFTLCFFFPASLKAEELTLPSPSVLPHTTREMKTAGFWISHHPSPDKILLNEKEIVAFNARTQDILNLTKDITKVSSYFSGLDLITELNKTLEDFGKRELYLGEAKAKKLFYEDMHRKMNINGIPLELKPQAGFIVHFADQKFFPTKQGLYEKPNDIDFDELQNSDLDVGTPVVILHESEDGKWCYVESEASIGWIEKEKVAVSNSVDLKKFLFNKAFVVVANPKADIFLNAKLTECYDYVRMGVQFPMLSETDNAFEINLPIRNEDGTAVFKSGFIKKEDVSVGFLSYTPRHILEQAFKLLNAPYGWGGMYGEQDCSRFLQEIFATVGIRLPRDSKDQAKVGLKISQFDETSSEDDKIYVLKEKAVAGTTLLPMKGHILLFLGVVDGRPYAIHETWGYRSKENNQDIVYVINRVAVTDLSLGEKSKKGSLLHRLSSVVVVTNP